MALNAYLTIAGQKQGAINGPVTEKGKENSIVVHAFNVGVISPRDPATGLPSGKRQHQPVSIVKEVDKTSPQLWSALVNNENLTTWILRFWTAIPTGLGAAGAEQQMYTVTLTNASIASMTDLMEDNQVPADVSIPLQEEITFTYQKIQWTWMEGNITAQDDWNSPVA